MLTGRVGYVCAFAGLPATKAATAKAPSVVHFILLSLPVPEPSQVGAVGPDPISDAKSREDGREFPLFLQPEARGGRRSDLSVPERAAGRIPSERLEDSRICLAAAEPEADAQNVRDQLTCHLIGAPDKATWNLEPWRPDVGLLETIAALCNPS